MCSENDNEPRLITCRSTTSRIEASFRVEGSDLIGVLVRRFADSFQAFLRGFLCLFVAISRPSPRFLRQNADPLPNLTEVIRGCARRPLLCGVARRLHLLASSCTYLRQLADKIFRQETQTPRHRSLT
jgi:hypothetical protein